MGTATASRVDLAKVDCRLAVTDAPVGDLPVHIHCNEHFKRIGKEDSTGSLAVYDGHLHCYGCRFHIARRLETLAYLLGVETRQAIRVAGKYTSESIDAYRERAAQEARRDPLPRATAQMYTSLLNGYRHDRTQWLLDRGLTPATITRFKLGHDTTRFTIPFFDAEGKLITVRFRRDDAFGTQVFNPAKGDYQDIPKYAGMRGRNGLYLYPEWLVAADTRTYLVVCEGEFDAMRLWQAGIPAMSVTNGAGNLRHVLSLLEPFKRVKHLVLAADQDEAGQLAIWGAPANDKHEELPGLNRLAMEAGYTTEVINWPRAWGKDITELYLSGHTLEEAQAWSIRAKAGAAPLSLSLPLR